ncbi:Rrf2 family transcriptional regulator [Seonamhaeicola sp.]|uniref:RrF2 family transcriptional regulator n=1 Tax=Seonamhaeicola sp. TaxID=1912245 RepID=UPI00261578EC|nr:Rrf2 family transcriptional regulator [Seonamhaeicola sp.]
MLSHSSKYAIKAVLFLAIHSDSEKKVMVKDISDPINVPQAYLAKLLQQLVKEHLVSSVRGPKGGFYLDDQNMNNSVIDIIYAIDGEEKLNACMLSLEKCNEEKPCPLHHILNTSRNDILSNLKDRTIKELAQDVEAGHAFLPL